MSYCLNPACEQPQNSDAIDRCQTCGAILRLKQRYRAIQPIGQGGFGRTFLAIDEAEPQQPRCVIKQWLPPADRAARTDSVRADLFRLEARRLAELGQHPQIPALRAGGTQAGQQYLILEFIAGQNLAQELADAGRFSERQIRDLLERVLPVLHFIHDRQVIHRDVKPANLIRQPDGQIVLVDFGAAKSATGAALIQTGTVIGSAEYVAPEQTRGKAVFASDLYSLGATCIHLLTGMSPFDLFDCSSDRWVWRDYLQTPVSASLGYVLDKLLERAISRRYQSAIEVQTDLATGATGALPAVESVRSVVTELARWTTTLAESLAEQRVRGDDRASQDLIWAEEAEAEPVWAEDEQKPVPPIEPIWAEDRSPEPIWAAEPNPNSSTPLWFKIALGLLFSSPFWLSVWNRLHSSP